MCDLSLETQGFFPGRGRGWRAWEDEFLKTFAAELGLRVSAEQLRRPPAEVALRISWLGISMPADKVSLAVHRQAPRLQKAPSAMKGARAKAPEGWLTCAELAKRAGCRTDRIYSAIWKKKLDALQGDRGVWLIPAEAAEEYLREHGKAQTPKEAPERPVGAKEGAGMENLSSEAEDAPETSSEAQKGHTPEIIPAEPLPDEPPAEASATRPEREPSPQAPDLASMSKLDILRALASGKTLGAANA